MSERVLDRVMDMADQLRDQAAEAEQIGRLTDDTVKLHEGGRADPAAAAQAVPAGSRSTRASSPRR